MRLSIITINRNNAEGLLKTIESVLAQTFKEFEYIIVDGASTDNSVDIIKEYIQKVECGKWKEESVLWVSEPDTGIYNAMNKGVRMSSGEYTLMLNSGDYLVDEHVIERILPELDGTDIIQGNTISENGGRLWRNRGYGKSDISFLDVQRGYFLHQASFCKRSLFEHFGYFNESNRYVSDTEFFIKALGFGGASFKYIDVDVANFDATGFSSTCDTKIRRAYKNEEMRMQEKLFPGRLYAYCIDSERKVELFDVLHKHRWLWIFLLLLKKIHDCVYGEPQVPISEEIKNSPY